MISYEVNMARPINADAEATRQRILDSALTLFAQRGHAGSSVRNIAGSAGVSLAMVHHYFGSKDALYNACVDRMYADLARLWDQSQVDLSGSEEFGELLERIVRRGLHFAWRHQLPMRLLMRTVMQAGGLDSERRRQYQVPFLDLASHYLATRFGGAPAGYRLPLQSLTFVVSRYAISSEEELQFLTDCDDLASARTAVREHVLAAARQLLYVADEPHAPN